MKKIFLIAVLTLGMVITGNAQEKKEKCKKSKHECTEMCKDGKHAYKHGEKGHKCSEECHKKM